MNTPSHLLSDLPTSGALTHAPINVAGGPGLASSPQKLVAAGGPGDPLLLLPQPLDETRNAKLRGCSFLGPSAIPLDPIDLIQQDVLASDPPRVEASQIFGHTILPLRTDLVCAGGLRLILVGDHPSDADVESGTHVSAKEPRTLKQLDIVAEVWIQP